MKELATEKPDAPAINLLLDFYGQLLTERSRETLDMHYGEDLSLAEIAEQLAITRQAVHDRIQQGLRSLSRYEDRLGLVARFRLQQQCVADAIREMDQGRYGAAREKLLHLSGLL